VKDTRNPVEGLELLAKGGFWFHFFISG